MAGVPGGFDCDVRRDGEAVITHHGRLATVLCGPRAADFVDEVELGDAQQVMARCTGNYKRGTERAARQHPRNCGR